MYRATTPKHIFAFDVDPETTFKQILITYSQGDQIVLEKTKADLTFDEERDCHNMYVCWLRLTQEEANLFDRNKSTAYQVQVRVLTYSGEAVAFPIERRSVDAVLNDEVLE